jgi:hypothetical protein
MTNMKSAPARVFAAFIFSAVFYVGGFTAAHAGVAGACDLMRTQFASLASAQGGDTDYSEQTGKELALRKKLLSQVLDCAMAEADNLQLRIGNLSLNDADAKKIQSQLSDQLGNAINYYAIQKSKIGDLGLQGSKNFAADLKTWRTGNYELSAKRASNFIIWAGNQALIEAAKNRINQIGQSVSLLKIVDNQKIQNAWDGAVSNFNEALKANDSAKQIFLAFGSPEDSLTSIKISLESLSATYQKFSDTISDINKALHP